MTLESIKIGAKVAYCKRPSGFGRGPDVTHNIAVVDKVTAAQASAGMLRFRLLDGKVIGQDHEYVVLATPDILALNESEQAAHAHYCRLVSRLNALKNAIERHTLTAEQMQAVAKAFDGQ